MSSGAAETMNDGPEVPLEQRRVYHNEKNGGVDVDEDAHRD
jgi:hypothetical protein